MESGEYRENIKDTISSAIDDVETDVKNILEFAEGIDTDSIGAMTDGIGTIISDLKELADKLY